MKKIVVLTLLVLLTSVLPSISEITDSKILEMKKDYESYGYKTCSGVLFDTFSFLVKGSDWYASQRWYAEDTDIKPGVLFFSIPGDDKNYGKTGQVFAQKGIDGQCWGTYSITRFYPNTNCSDYMAKNDFNKKNGWDIESRAKNGDGGERIFLNVEGKPALKFILNDTPTGCNFSKFESF